MVGVGEIATTWLDFPCRMDLIQQPPVWAVFGDVACGQVSKSSASDAVEAPVRNTASV
jgi:hypothetical protein